MRNPFARAAAVAMLTAILLTVAAGSALACGGLVTPNGTVSLLKTTTLAAYHDGIEHYVTSFEFAGEGQEVGSIIPLPGVPTDVIKGGDWTLQRLTLETQPQPAALRDRFLRARGRSRRRGHHDQEIDALDITVLKGGAVEVGNWAREHGYFLPPDAPEVLAFYAERSPIFLAARFNADRAANRGVQTGQGTPVHIVIPTPSPWVPLRILALGREASEIVQGTSTSSPTGGPRHFPRPSARRGSTRANADLIQEVSEPASSTLLTDLRSDRGMKWLPESDMWLTYIRVNETAGNLKHDLAIDASGYGRPSPVAAGYPVPRRRAVVGRLDRDGRARCGPRRDGDHGSGCEAHRLEGVPSVKLRAAAAAVALVLLVGAAAASRGAAARANDGTIRLTIHYSKFDPADLVVEPGETVRFVIVNTDPIDHEFILGDERVQLVHEEGTEAHHAPRPGEVSVPAGKTVVTTYSFPEVAGC